jgi:hypothetical protein
VVCEGGTWGEKGKFGPVMQPLLHIYHCHSFRG